MQPVQGGDQQARTVVVISAEVWGKMQSIADSAAANAALIDELKADLAVLDAQHAELNTRLEQAKTDLVDRFDTLMKALVTKWDESTKNAPQSQSQGKEVEDKLRKELEATFKQRTTNARETMDCISPCMNGLRTKVNNIEKTLTPHLDWQPNMLFDGREGLMGQRNQLLQQIRVQMPDNPDPFDFFSRGPLQP